MVTAADCTKACEAAPRPTPVEGLNSRNLGVESVQPKQERPVLSRDLSEFLVELSIALHRHSMYPSGHPSLGPAVASVVRHAERLLFDRATIAFGVARRQLIIEGVTTDPNQPVLRRLAEGLHSHHLGAISVMRGIEACEVGEALRALSAEPERDGPLGLNRSSGPRTDWPHIKLHPLTFDRLAIVGDAPMASGGGSQAATRSAELWVGLARAAIAIEGESTENVSTEPSVVAKAIDEHQGAEAYDQVIRAIGVAGLLHDIGKTRIPIEVLTKPGKLTDEERLIMNAHPVDGARLILQSEEDLDLAATVAYEHHVMLDGGGYPRLHYRRECMLASRLVHVCDVYDALSTRRPYRDAWPSGKTLAYLEERAGTEFDPDLVAAFVRTLRQGETQIRLLTEEQPPVAEPAPG